MSDPHLVLGKVYRPWRLLQHGQEKITRFNRYLESFKDKMRHQNGHEHRCSVSLLFDYIMVEMRPYVQLDELLLTRCISHHDEPEGILKIDLCATLKTSKDDLGEYLVFQDLYKPLGQRFWEEMQRVFLLQFCLENPSCFPTDARKVMGDLANFNRNEALFFDGVQRFDYLFYAFECYAEQNITRILRDVAENQISKLDKIAKELQGFNKVVWTPERREFFQEFVNKHPVDELQKVS